MTTVCCVASQRRLHGDGLREVEPRRRDDECVTVSSWNGSAADEVDWSAADDAAAADVELVADVNDPAAATLAAPTRGLLL